MKSETRKKRMDAHIKLAQEWKASGMTQAEFASAKGIGLSALEYRIRKVRETAPEKLSDEEQDAVEFVQLSTGRLQRPVPAENCTQNTGQPTLSIHLSGAYLQARGQVEPHLLKTALEVILTC